MKDWIRRNPEDPDEYRAEMDVVGNFISECCEVALGFSVKFAELYGAYKLWAQQNPDTVVIDERTFAEALDNKEHTLKRTKNGRFRRGLRLKMGEG